MSCRERVIDVFVTQNEYDKDDEFVGPVWSIECVGTTKSRVVNKSTPWIMFASSAVTTELMEGDIVRIGDLNSAGHTDYATVLEVRPHTHLSNFIHTGASTPATAGSGLAVNTLDHRFVDIMYLPTKSLPLASAPLSNNVFGTMVEGTAQAIDHKVYRLNIDINATSIPVPVAYKSQPDDIQKRLIFEQRHTTEIPGVTGSDLEKAYFPLYRLNKPSAHINAALDHGVKALHWIKLIGYSMFNKRQVGFAHQHEMIEDDWVAMSIEQIQGNVISNNPHANGSFAVLHVGSSDDSKLGATEFYQHDPQGIYTHYFDNHQSTIRNLNFKFVDRKGNPAHFGRIHLWFKMCVAHG